MEEAYSISRTASALARIRKNLRELAAQMLLGFALRLDADTVMSTVAEGVRLGERRAGLPAGSWAKRRGID